MKRRRKDYPSGAIWALVGSATAILLLWLGGGSGGGLLQVGAIPQNSALKLEPESNGYTGLTFTFDPRLERRLERLHFDHWQSIVHQSSSMLYEALNGRAHLAEVRVLIPYKWRQSEWPLLHKPGVPIMMNRRVRYADSDVLVGFEDPTYKETPFAVQHDECSRPGLNIRMPISFLEDRPELEPKLKARQLVREFASHRYGVFKESGFRHDFMYPPFSSLAGIRAPARHQAGPGLVGRQNLVQTLNTLVEWNALGEQQNKTHIRGYDERWDECPFETSPGSGLPSGRAISCAPYLSRPTNDSLAHLGSSAIRTNGWSFNLMSADPFAHVATGYVGNANQPLEYRNLGDSVAWHFCGENFPSPNTANLDETSKQARLLSESGAAWYMHNQLATNKQNIMCEERGAMEVIKSSDDFRRTQYSPSNFNRLPATNFKFLQEMPPRLILCVEYTSHLYQSRRLDHGILEAAIAKYLAFDLIADSEMALVLFGQQHSTRNAFKKLDSSLDARLTLFSPPIDPFDEPARYYSDQELIQLEIQTGSSATGQSAGAKLVKGTCSFAKVMAEAHALQSQRSQYDDLGADIVIITSGLFVEDEMKIEEIIRSSFQQEQSRLNLIIYPSTMLFDVKSRDGFVVLDAIESESIVKDRLNKLHLIQKLTGAQIHLVKEHLDANGDVKMSTLIQFYQIFDQLSKGHSWDQTSSMLLIDQQSVESKPVGSQAALLSPGSSKQLVFHFEVDSTIQNELIVGFIDPKQHQQSRSGKRFALKSLQLKSPGGHLILTDTHPWPISGHIQATNDEIALAQNEGSLNNQHPVSGESSGQSSSDASLSNSLRAGSATESALFPYRTQMGLAGFHLKSGHLAQLNASRRLAGTWTLMAFTDEPIQTDAIAMARVNPSGDTITANCWIQSYFEQPATNSEVDQVAGTPQLKAVKVFLETKGGPQIGFIQQVNARLEVQDEMGNIVQNVNMLDDGLGSPDMTRGDGIHSQYVQRAHRPGYYRVNVDLTGNQVQSPRRNFQQHLNNVVTSGQSGQDNTCCGSFIPSVSGAQSPPSTRHLSRRLYCGSFYADANNRLGQQRPPRVNNLTVANVDQDSRKVVIRWFEPSVDISAYQANKQALETSNELSMSSREGSSTSLASRKRRRSTSSSVVGAELEFDESASGSGDTSSNQRARGLVVDPSATANSRYEIKLFTDRDMAKRAFDAKQEVGFKFNEWNVDGIFPNASNYGGMKEVTLKIPDGREGIYFIAMKVYNNLGVGSHMSNIVQFWIRNNLTLEEAESIYGQATTVDAAGNVYDRNGELLQRGSGPHLSYSLLRGSPLDGISLLMFISIMAFVVMVVCLSLVACLATSACRALGPAHQGKKHFKSADRKGVIMGSSSSAASTAVGQVNSAIGSGCSSSSSGCASSQQSEIASSMSAGSEHGAHDVEISNKLALVADEIHYNQLQAQHQQQQQQAQLIQQSHQMLSSSNAYQIDSSMAGVYPQSHQFGDSQKGSNQNWLQHTLVNGYPYATVNTQTNSNQTRHKITITDKGLHGSQQFLDQAGDLNQNGLSGATMSPVQSWPAEILLNHYDKVKQARERNEAPPVMRIETLEQQGHFGDGLPTVDELQQQQQQSGDQSYLIRQNRQMPSYFNKQLQQQLSSVLKNKQLKLTSSGDQELDLVEKSSPALEGLTEPHEMDNGSHYGQTMAPPPPQYVYCTPASHEHLQPSSMLVEPSLYSQVTNLQQVSDSNQGVNLSADYYANQSAQWSSSMYSGSGQAIEQYQPQAHSRGATTHQHLADGSLAPFVGIDKSSSAISEV